jgi:hypothetical protein
MLFGMRSKNITLALGGVAANNSMKPTPESSPVTSSSGRDAAYRER